MLDFEDYSFTQPAILVTIQTELVLKDSIIKLLKSLKVMGYSVSTIQGEGRCGPLGNNNPFDEAVETTVSATVDTPVEIKVLASPDLANVILYALKEHQKEFAIVAYRQKVEALLD